MNVSADRIRQARIERGWTQQQLAEIANLSLRTVQRVENQAVASNETVSALCAVLELSRNELLLQDPTRPEHQAAAARLRLLLPIAVMLGAALGSGLTVLLMSLGGAG
ncbi:helix-turn-helix transcriptional regulator [Wenzhouxiangella sp. XN24]|uniref:helix-turn-helix domain-containing protein n=1 Tax=Wenzhouxiangella sp. XN24 TaxID=2713569 RepID=UPI0013EBA8EA|nr:helix-turn-helix transcriptional regulator [Wenzhouxiangella sp. XN24]NGX16300.1 helix-turn-helix transcriptional regulator [Wenzhouxiangella sp. XN24]